MQKSQKGVANFKASILGAAKVMAGAFAVRAVGRAITSVADLGDQLQKTAQRTGIAVETLNGLQFAATQGGTSLETLNTGLRTMAKNLFDASNGTGEAKDALEQLGISSVDSQGNLRGTEDVLTELAEKFSQFEDGTTKAALAQRILGRSGAELIPLLNGGAAGLASMVKEANELRPITAQQAQESAAFNDALDRLTKAGEGFLNKVILPMLPLMTDMIGAFVEFAGPVGTAVTFTLAKLAQAFQVLIFPAKEIIALLTFGFAAATEAMSGNFGTARQILSDMADEMGDIKKEAMGAGDALLSLSTKVSDFNNTQPSSKSATSTAARTQTRIGPTGAPPKVQRSPQGDALANQEKLAAISEKTSEKKKKADEALTFAQVRHLQSLQDLDAEDTRRKKATADELAFAEIVQLRSLQDLEAEFSSQKKAGADAIQARKDEETILGGRVRASRIRGVNPAETTRLEVELLNTELERLRDQDVMTAGQQARVMVITAELDKLNSTMTVMGVNIRDDLGGSFKGFFKDVSRGENVFKSLGDSFDQFANRMSDKLIDMASDNLFQQFFGKKGGKGGGGGGLFDSIGGFFGGGGDGLLDSLGGFFGAADGGIVPGRRVLGFAHGGIAASDTIPAMLTPGEGILSVAGMRNLAALNSGRGLSTHTHVFINNNSGVPAEVSRSQNSSGGEDIFVALDRKMSERIRAGGPSAKAIEDLLGKTRVPRLR